MTKTANRPRRLTTATALIDVQSSVPYQISELTQRGHWRERRILLDAALAADAVRERLDAMENR